MGGVQLYFTSIWNRYNFPLKHTEKRMVESGEINDKQHHNHNKQHQGPIQSLKLKKLLKTHNLKGF